MATDKLNADEDCPFCQIVADMEGRTESDTYGLLTVFEPLNPVVPGHLLVIPNQHVQNAGEDPEVTGRTFCMAARVAEYRYDNYNLITSVGAPATQTVQHLHVHIVPRKPDDGLHLPWTGQQK